METREFTEEEKKVYGVSRKRVMIAGERRSLSPTGFYFGSKTLGNGPTEPRKESRYAEKSVKIKIKQ